MFKEGRQSKNKILLIAFSLVTSLMVMLPSPVYAANIIEKAFSSLIMMIATGILMLTEKWGGLSIADMIAQGTNKPELAYVNYSQAGQAVTGFDLTTVRVADAAGAGEKINCLFDIVIGQVYPYVFNVSIVIFIVMVAFLGLKLLMAFATAQRVEYIDKLKAWTVGLLILFAFNYVNIFIIKANNSLAYYILSISGVFEQKPPPESGIKDSILDYINQYNTDKVAFNTSKVYKLKDNDDKELEPAIEINIKRSYIPWNTSKEKSPFNQIGRALYRDGDYDDDKIEMNLEVYSNGWSESAEKLNASNYQGALAPGDCYYVQVGPSGEYYNKIIFFKSDSLYEPLSSEVWYNDAQFKFQFPTNLGTGDVCIITGPDLAASEGGGFNGVTEEGLKLPESVTQSGGISSSYLMPKDPFLRTFFNEWVESANKDGMVVSSLIYLGAVALTLWFFIVYFLRMILIAFLLLLFPIVVAIYCVGKVNGGQSGIFGSWLNQFTTNVFTNSIHALTFGIIFSTIISKEGIPSLVKLIALFCLIPANNLVREILGEMRGGGGDHTDDAGAAAIAGGYAIAQHMKKGLKGSGRYGAGRREGGGYSSGEGYSQGEYGEDGEEPVPTTLYGRFYNRITGMIEGGPGAFQDNVVAPMRRFRGASYRDKAGMIARTSGKGLARALKGAVSAGGVVLRIGGKAAGAASGATIMLSTGQHFQQAIAGGYFGYEVGKGITDRITGTANSLSSFGTEAVDYMALRSSIKGRDEVIANVFAGAVIFSDSKGNIFYSYKEDNSFLTTTKPKIDKEGRLENGKNAAYSYKFKTDSSGRIEDNTVEMYEENIQARLDKVFASRILEMEREKKEIGQKYFESITALDKYDLTLSGDRTRAETELKAIMIPTSDGQTGNAPTSDGQAGQAPTSAPLDQERGIKQLSDYANKVSMFKKDFEAQKVLMVKRGGLKAQEIASKVDPVVRNRENPQTKERGARIINAEHIN